MSVSEDGGNRRAQGNARRLAENGSIGRVASLKYGSSFCGSAILIGWEADDKGKIESIGTYYGDSGCP